MIHWKPPQYLLEASPKQIAYALQLAFKVDINKLPGPDLDRLNDIKANRLISMREASELIDALWGLTRPTKPVTIQRVTIQQGAMK